MGEYNCAMINFAKNALPYPLSNFNVMSSGLLMVSSVHGRHLSTKFHENRSSSFWRNLT